MAINPVMLAASACMALAGPVDKQGCPPARPRKARRMQGPTSEAGTPHSLQVRMSIVTCKSGGAEMPNAVRIS